MNRRSRLLATTLLIAALIAGCLPAPTLAPTATASPTPTAAASATPQATGTPLPTDTPAPTATPDPSTTEIRAEAASGLDLAHFGAGQAFTVRFDRPMDPASAATPLQVYPYLVGQAAWNTERTALSFTPGGSWQAGQDYYLFLDRNLKDSFGKTLPQLAQWKIHVQEGPRVVEEKRDPSQGSDFQPVFKVSFDRPMDRASVEKAFTVEPAAAVKFSWQPDLNAPTPTPRPTATVTPYPTITPRGSTAATPTPARSPQSTPESTQEPAEILTISVAKELTPGVNYLFTLGKETVAKNGAKLEEAVEWSYHLAGLQARVDTISPYQVSLTLNYAIDLQQAIPLLKFDPEVAGSWQAVNDTALEFTPREPFLYGQAYTLQTGGRIKAALLSRWTDFDLEALNLNIPSPVIDPKLTNTNSLDPTGTLQINFTMPMDPVRTEAATRISPEIAGRFSWNDNHKAFSFIPTGALSSGTQYTVTITPDAADEKGHPVMAAPCTLTYYTSSLSDRVYSDNPNFGSGGPHFQALDAGGRRAIQFANPGRSRTATFSLTPLTIGDFASRYARYQKDNPYLSYRYSYYAQKMDAFLDLSPAQTWTANIDSASYNEVILPANVPPGLYALGMTNGSFTDYIFVGLTHYLLAVKSGAGRVSTWAADFNGNPAPNLEVRLYGEQGANLVEGTTDQNGAWSSAVSPGVNIRLALAIAGKPEGISLSGDVAAAGLDSSFANSNGAITYSGEYSSGGSGIRAYTYTDRPIYKPGQAVNYKVILRAENDARYDLPPEGSAVTISLLDARSNVAASQTQKTNAFGTASGSFSLAEGAMLGGYKLQVEASGQTSTLSFEVQEYRKPEFEIRLKPAATQLVRGDSVELDVEAKYFTGEPLASTRLTVIYYIDGGGYGWYSSGWNNFNINDSCTTDEQGRCHLSWRPNFGGYFPDAATVSWMAQVSGSDSSGNTVSATVQGKEFSAGEKIELNRERYIYGAGSKAELSLRVTDLQGQPVAGREVTGKLSWSSYEESIFTWKSTSHTIETPGMSTGVDGRAKLTVDFKDVSGYATLAVTSRDNRGNSYSQSTYFYISDHSTAINAASSGINISAERLQYKPYETAHFTIESDFSGPALLTFERGGVLRSLPVQLTAPRTEIAQDLGEECAPNVFVRVSAWRPNDTQALFDQYSQMESYYTRSIADSSWISASVEIRVDASLRSLNVRLTPGKEQYGPRQEASFSVQVTDAGGKPVQAEVSLALVDEAIFSLKSDPAGAILTAFYGLRRNNVSTYDEMQPNRALTTPGRGAGGGGVSSPPGANPRSEFADTAVWLPAVVTDVNGKATIKATLPDNLTRWRLTARAVTRDTRVGEATANITISQEVIVRPALPNGLTLGDRSQVGAVIANTTGRALDLEARLQAAPAEALTLEGLAAETIHLQPGEIRLVSWWVRAAKAADEAVQVTISAGDPRGETGDAIRLPLTIRPFGAPTLTTASGGVGGSGGTEFNTVLAAPPETTGGSQVEVSLSRSLGGSLLKGLNDLTHYPYGCVEQTMSAALPNALVGRAYTRLGMKADVPPDLSEKINSGLQRLYNMQHNDGGWGWWTDDQTDTYMTAWVLFGLSLTREAGAPVSAASVDLAAKYLDNLIKTKNPGDDERTQAFALYSLALAGKGNLEKTEALAARSQQLDPFSQAALALALQRLDDPISSTRLVNGLARGLVRKDGQAYLPNDNSDGEYHQKTMASGLRTTALVMEAFIQILPDDPRIAEMENYLMSQRKSFGWGTTNETAFALLALTDRLEQAQSDPRPAGYTLTLNGTRLAEDQLEPGKETLQLTIPAAQMLAGANLFHLETRADGAPLYYTLTSRMYVPESSYQPAGNLNLRREYLPPDGKSLADLRVGDKVTVRLTYTLDSNKSYLMITDHLPGGLEAVNERLNTSGYQGDPAWIKPIFYYNDYGYNQKEIRGNQVLFFVTNAYRSTNTITYMARVTRPGDYRANPAEISMMYDTSQWGRSGSDRIEVKELSTMDTNEHK